MTDRVRSVAVRLSANVRQYQAAMLNAGKSTKSVIEEMDQAAKNHKQSLNQVAGAATIAGTALLGGFLLASRSAMNFDKQLSSVQAVSGATADEMSRLRQAALDAGKATVFSASDAAAAETELAKAGLSTADILGGALTGSLNLAAAGGLELADAATVSAQAMKMFGLAGKDVSHIADVLTAGANKSAADVAGLGMALSQSGLVAHQTGLTFEETTGALAAFADAGLVGSDAGTSLKTMLLALNPKSDDAGRLMEQLGISAYDASGQFVGLSAYAGKLQAALGDMSAEQRNSTLQTIFGTDAIRAANVLYTQGAEGISKYVRSVDDYGAAARQAQIMTDNLAGDLEQLRGAMETALIGTGSESTGVLRTMTQDATAAVNAYNALPGPIKGVAGAAAGMGGALLLAGGAFAFAVPKISDTRRALKTLNEEMPKTARGLKMLGRAGVTLSVLAVGANELQAGFDKLTAQAPEIERTTAALLKSADLGEVFKNNADRVDTFGESLGRITHPAVTQRLADFAGGWAHANVDLREARASMDSVDQALSSLVQSGATEQAADAFEDLAAQAQASGFTVDDLKDVLPKYQTALQGAANQTKITEDATGGLNNELDEEVNKLADLLDAFGKMHTDQIDLAEGQIAVEEATRKVNGKLEKYNEAVAKNGENSKAAKRAHDKYAQALRDSERAVLEQADLARDFAEQQAAVAGRTDGAQLGAQAYRKELAKLRNGMAPGSPLRKYIQGLIDELDDLAQDRVSTVTIRTATISVGTHDRRKRKGKAGGGWVSGPGTGTSDDVPLWASDGEFVVKAQQARRYAGLLHAINSGASVTPAMVSSSTHTSHAPVINVDARNSQDPAATAAAAERAVGAALDAWEMEMRAT